MFRKQKHLFSEKYYSHQNGKKNKSLLCSTENYIQYPMINQMESNIKKDIEYGSLCDNMVGTCCLSVL